MKKVSGLIAVLVMVVSMVILYGHSEKVDETEFHGMVYGRSGSEVQTMLEDWMEHVNGMSAYSNCEVNDEGFLCDYGVVSADEFEETYRLRCNENNMIKVLKDHYDGLETEITDIGYHYTGNEWFNVYKIDAKANVPIGHDYETETEYYEVSVLFMVYSEEEP